VRTGLEVSELGDLLTRPILATLATHRADGSILLSPVWHEWRDGGFNVVVEEGDVKFRHVTRDPRVTILVAESVLPYRGVEVRCAAKIVREGAGEAMLRIASRYLGDQGGHAYAGTPSGTDVLLRLDPGSLRAWDFSDAF
jgi:PPOX class probable F420-dependent enzyme